MKNKYVVQWSPNNPNYFMVGATVSSDISVCRVLDKREILAEDGSSNSVGKYRTVGHVSLPGGSLKSLDWNPSLDNKLDVCLGTSRGLSIARLSQGMIDSPSLLSTVDTVDVVKVDQTQRQCNAVAWCPYATNRIAAGYQLVRKGNGVLVWDINITQQKTSHGPTHHSPLSLTASSIDVGTQGAGAEAVSWDPIHHDTIAVGSSNSYLSLYDFRSGNMTFTQDTIRGPVYGVKYDPNNPYSLATFGGEQTAAVRIYDSRRLMKPVGVIQSLHRDKSRRYDKMSTSFAQDKRSSGVIQIGWSPIRQGLLAVAEERWVYVYDTMLATSIVVSTSENLGIDNVVSSNGDEIDRTATPVSGMERTRHNHSDGDLSARSNEINKSEPNKPSSKPTTPIANSNKGNKLETVSIGKPLTGRSINETVSNFAWKLVRKKSPNMRSVHNFSEEAKSRMLVVSVQGTAEIISIQGSMPIALNSRGAMAFGINSGVFSRQLNQLDVARDLRELAEKRYSIDANSNCDVISQLLREKEAALKLCGSNVCDVQENVIHHKTQNGGYSMQEGGESVNHHHHHNNNANSKSNTSSTHQGTSTTTTHHRGHHHHNHHHHHPKQHFPRQESSSGRHHHHHHGSSKEHQNLEHATEFISVQDDSDVLAELKQSVLSLREVLSLWQWIKVTGEFGIHDLHNIGLCHLFRNSETFDTRSERVSSPLRSSFYQFRSPLREAALALCGWGSSRQNLEPVFNALQRGGKYHRAAALRVLQCDLGGAVRQLQEGVKEMDRSEGSRSRHSELLSMVSMSIAGFPLNGTAVLWQKACRELLCELDEIPVLKAALNFLLHVYLHDTDMDDLAEVQLNEFRDSPVAVLFDDDSFSVVEKAVIACLYLPDQSLAPYLETLLEHAMQVGSLGGIVLSGMGSAGVNLMQQYVEITGDIQTVALATLHMKGGNSDDQRNQIYGWVESYRELLNRWQLWEERATLDVQIGTNLRSSEYSTSNVSVSSSLSTLLGQDAAEALVNASYGFRTQSEQDSAGNEENDAITHEGAGNATLAHSSKRDEHKESVSTNLNDKKLRNSETQKAHASESSTTTSVALRSPTVMDPHISVRCGKCFNDIAAKTVIKVPGMNKRGSQNVTKPIIPHCPHCKQALPHCAVCLLSMSTYNINRTQNKGKANTQGAPPPTQFDKWFSWCLQCGHGGHASCLVDWYGTHSQCPVSSCRCVCSAE